mmetsp:Transcript_3029/g.6715  ORF Transcript_3029/g.6715 Transcript_3029/m.6715 type:complete len:178 (-) Transcript_3029:845-1378(-)
MDAHQASSHQIQHRDSEPCGTDNQKDEAESWNRVAAMLVSLGSACCKCIMSPFCTLYLFLANEEHGRVHHAQEFENRFWNIFCSPFFDGPLLLRIFLPLQLGERWSARLGFCVVVVVLVGYAMRTPGIDISIGSPFVGNFLRDEKHFRHIISESPQDFGDPCERPSIGLHQRMSEGH